MTDTVSGVLRLFGDLTVEALKLVSVRRGHDPRDFTLIAFGGGGPIHAGHLARELGVKQLIIPNFPGTFSAWGMLTSEPRIDLSRTMVLSLETALPARRDLLFSEMQTESEATLTAHGFTLDTISHQRAIDCRYHGQEHTVRVPVLADETDADFAQRFHLLHRMLYTFSLEKTAIELVNFRLTSTVRSSLTPEGQSQTTPETSACVPEKSRDVAFATGDQCDVAIYQRESIPFGFVGAGPAIIEESSSTTVVLSDQKFEIDQFGNIVIAGNQPNRKEFSGIG